MKIPKLILKQIVRESLEEEDLPPRRSSPTMAVDVGALPRVAAHRKETEKIGRNIEDLKAMLYMKIGPEKFLYSLLGQLSSKETERKLTAIAKEHNLIRERKTNK